MSSRLQTEFSASEVVTAQFRTWLGEGLSKESFFSKYWQNSHFVVRGPSTRITAIRELLGALEVSNLVRHLKGEGEVVGAWGPDRRGARTFNIRTSMHNALELHDKAGYTLYFDAGPALRPFLANFAADCSYPSEHAAASLFVSHAGAMTSAHVDRNENFTIQLAGSKKWWIYSDGLDSERFREDRRDSDTIAIEVTAGDIIYVPGTWPHAVSSTSDSISLNMSLQHYTWAQFIGEQLPNLVGPGANVLKETPLGLWGDDPNLLARAIDKLEQVISALRSLPLHSGDFRTLESFSELADATPLNFESILQRNRAAVLQVHDDRVSVRLPNGESTTIDEPPPEFIELLARIAGREQFTLADSISDKTGDLDGDSVLEFADAMVRTGVAYPIEV